MNDTPIGKILGKMAMVGLQEVVTNGLSAKKLHCEATDSCELFSLGIRCGCGKLLCNHHLYFQMNTRTLKPEAICPSCVAGNHPEIFDDE